MPRTLLLADDSVTIQKVVGISFANEDVVLLTVDNGDDAIARAREARPDLVLADVVMPGKNGYEVCEAIKSSPELAHVPVVLLTGTFEAFDDERARRVRADAHITKPFEAQALVELVNRLLAQSAPPPPADAPPLVPGPAGSTEEAYDFFEEDIGGTAASAPAPPPAPDEDLFASAPNEPFEVESSLDDQVASVRRESAAPPRERPAAASGADLEAAADPTVMIGEDGVPDPIDADLGTDDFVDVAVAQAPSSTAATGSDGGLGATRILGDAEALGDALESASPEDLFSREETFDFEFGETSPEGREPTAAATRGRATEVRDPLADLEPADFAGDALLDPEAAAGHDVSSSDLGDPLAEPFVDAPPPPVPDSAPSAPEAESTPPFERTAPGAPVTVPPDVRDRVHQTLEKMAWEAFGDLSERIVREAVAKIEAVAWEVVPQMTETLVREAIRRLEEDGEES